MKLNSCASPRWLDGPLVCRAVNMCAYETREAAASYYATHLPAIVIEKIWECAACGGWHVASHPREISDGGTRALTKAIPALALATAERLSKLDTARYERERKGSSNEL